MNSPASSQSRLLRTLCAPETWAFGCSGLHNLGTGLICALTVFHFLIRAAVGGVISETGVPEDWSFKPALRASPAGHRNSFDVVLATGFHF